jgi:hypothetical protein|tara:strand:+ start:6010 stop:6468 length:459 start_codon:yes stop_codon:yes gene_type:complete
MYLKVSGSTITYPYSVQNLKIDNQNTSFPTIITDSLLETFGVYNVELKDSGYDDDYTKDVVEVTPTLSGSVYVQTYEISDADEATINTRKEIKWSDIRDSRNTLLSNSDWTQFQDSPITGSQLTDWQNYRQSLRDVTTQSDPYNIVWPTKPS